MKKLIALASACSVTAAWAQVPATPQPAAQQAVFAPVVAPAPVFQAQPNVAYLRSGTPVLLKTSEALTTEHKKMKVGQRFQLEVAENVVIDGRTVIPTGSPAVGEITNVKNKGMWGKSGKLVTRVLSVRVGDRTIRMTGGIDDKGAAGTGGVVASVLVLPVAGFFVTGRSARIPLGTPVKGFVDEDVPLAFAPSAPAPLAVAAPAVASPALPAAAVPVAVKPQ